MKLKPQKVASQIFLMYYLMILYNNSVIGNVIAESMKRWISADRKRFLEVGERKTPFATHFRPRLSSLNTGSQSFSSLEVILILIASGANYRY